jgi:hypothetical protein
MTIFDLLFLAAALAAVASVVVLVVARLRGRRDRARTVARRLGIGVVCYLAAGVAVSWLRPHPLIEMGTPCRSRRESGRTRPFGLRGVSTCPRVRLRSGSSRVTADPIAVGKQC